MAAAGMVLLALGMVPGAEALIFPQLGEEYDRNQNKISMEEAWKLGHAVGFMHGVTGIAIAPNWFVTAAHLASTSPKVFDCPVGSYKILEMVPLVGDTMLCRVDYPFSRYSRLAARPLRTGDLVRLYGRSSAHWAKAPYRDADGIIRGWTIGAEARESMGLRWGLARLSFAEAWSLNWTFSAFDPEVGTNCAGVVHMDSGGGIFLGSDLAGLVTTGTQPMRSRVNVRQSSKDCAGAYLFDPTNLFNCNVPTPLPTNNISYTSAMPLGPNLDRIYEKIAPPLRVKAGGDGTNEWRGWTGGNPVVSFTAPVAGTNALPAPPTVYGSAVFAQGTNFITYPATNLLTTERYTLRLHFGAVPFLEPGEVLVDVYVNGINRAARFDPAGQGGAEGRPAMLEIPGLEPESGSKASITLAGVGRKRLVYLSGLELILERRQP